MQQQLCLFLLYKQNEYSMMVIETIGVKYMQILYEDEEVIVCYKPSGIPTQTASAGTQDMVSLLKNYFYKKNKDRKDPYVGVIHRLDQPVEGVLVFAKTPFAAKKLSQGLQAEGFGKHYKAVLWGIPEEDSGTLVDYLVKDGRTNVSRIATPKEAGAKEARLSFEVIGCGNDEGKDVSLVKIQLDTGRHHQIRVQMSHMGNPIWGDSKYNTLSVQDRRYRQIALCAYHLEFPHPTTGKPMIFEVEPKGEGFLLLDKSKKFQ